MHTFKNEPHPDVNIKVYGLTPHDVIIVMLCFKFSDPP